MRNLPRSVHRKIPSLGKAGTLACGAIVHVIDRDMLRAGDIAHIGAADEVANSITHTGWFVDPDQHDTMTGQVYGNGARYLPDGYGGLYQDDGDYYGYIATAEAWDTVYVDAEYYTNVEDAAIAADSLAETIAEHERTREEIHNAAATLRHRLHEANQDKLEALAVKACGVQDWHWRDRLAAAQDARAAVWREIDDTMPAAWNPREHESFMVAWHDGWQCGA